jgi:hypothetical protein
MTDPLSGLLDSLHMPPYPPRRDLPDGVIAQTWRVTVSRPFDPSADLRLFADRARTRALVAMERCLKEQGDPEPAAPPDDFRVAIITDDPLHWSLEFEFRRDRANSDFAFVRNVCWVIEQSHGPIVEFEGVARREWWTFPLPPPDRLRGWAREAP